VFRTGSSTQPVATISFICAALFVRPKGHIGTREVRNSEAGADDEIVSRAI
jgi:hypothetical protein